LVRAIVPSLILALSSTASAQQTDVQLAQNLKKLSIEELTRLDITTASRRVEPLAQAAAAASVLRGEDLRRAGVTNLAEALRLADGIDVARADNETWAISTRGFNIPTANKITIALTAYASERDRERSALAGYQRHLAKPIDPLELVNVIAGMLPTEVQPRG
jgi:iron complex outermembrane receptor protein